MVRVETLTQESPSVGSMVIGAKEMAGRCMRGLVDYEAANNNHVIVRDLRLPRTFLRVLVRPAPLVHPSRSHT